MGDYQQFSSDIQPKQQRQLNPASAMSSGLARYQSAPSSYFDTLLNTNIEALEQNCNAFVNPQYSTLNVAPQNSSANEPQQSRFIAAPMKSEKESYVRDQQQLQRQVSSGYSSVSQTIPENQSLPSMPNLMPTPVLGTSYLPEMNSGGGRSTNLLRQSSSPANFFANFDIEGYGVNKSMGNFGRDKGTNLEASVPSPNRLKGQHDFTSGLPSSSGIMTPISEIENKNIEMSGPSFPFNSWDDSDIFSDGFLKGLEDDERKTFPSMSASEIHNDEVGNHHPPSMLSHHLSLPKASMEKLLQLQDSVPCKIRAKRGCATHPRSIAERVRRTRISERMRKLQELVPNMDKQTNTSDMLDLAVDYIKGLQDQVQTLSDNRENCTCSNQQTQ